MTLHAIRELSLFVYLQTRIIDKDDVTWMDAWHKFAQCIINGTQSDFHTGCCNQD